MSYHVISRHIISYHIISLCHITSCHIIYLLYLQPSWPFSGINCDVSLSCRESIKRIFPAWCRLMWPLVDTKLSAQVVLPWSTCAKIPWCHTSFHWVCTMICMRLYDDLFDIGENAQLERCKTCLIALPPRIKDTKTSIALHLFCVLHLTFEGIFQDSCRSIYRNPYHLII